MACLSKQVPVQILQEYRGPTTPITPKRYRFGLFRVRSPLLAESQLFSLPAGTKMFQFPAFALPIRKYLVFNQVGYPIRKCPDQWSFAPTRSLSQLTTSFIASQSQGIHRSLFLSFSYAKIVVLRLTRNPSFYLHCELIFFLLVKNLHRLFLNNLILAFTLFQYVKDHSGIYELRFPISKQEAVQGALAYDENNLCSVN